MIGELFENWVKHLKKIKSVIFWGKKLISKVKGEGDDRNAQYIWNPLAMISLENIYHWYPDLLEGDQQGGGARQQRRRVRGLSQKVSQMLIIEIQ